MRFDFKLMGVNFRPPVVKDIVNQFSAGDEVECSLEREPENAYDENAIKVVERTSGEFIGYVQKQIAELMAPLLDAGAVPVGAFSVLGMEFARGAPTPTLSCELEEGEALDEEEDD